MRAARKLSTAVGVSAAIIGLVAGCSSGSSNNSSSSSGSSGAKTLSGTSFTVLGQWTGAEQKAFQSVLDAFDAKTGAKATYTPAAGGDMATVLGAKVNGGTPPDVAILSLPGAIAQYATAGKLQPVGSDAESAVKQNFAGEWATLATSGGQLYGVPVDASNKSTVWYDANAFKNAGISSTPATWDDLIKDAGTLSDSGVTVPISVGGGDGWTLTDWFENVYLRTAGLDNYDKLTKHQIPFTDPSVITALTTLKQIWANKQLIGDPAQAAKTAFTASVDNVFKSSPTSAIVYEASFVATTITGDKDPAKVGTDAKFFPFPSINGSKAAVEAAGDFAVGFTTNKAVQQFLAYLASPEASKLLVSATGSGFLSANKNLDTSAYPDSTSADLAKQVVTVGSNFRFDMSDQTPAAFGGTKDTGEWADLQSFLQTGDVQGTATKLEQDAAAATGWGQ